jgi:riboflavin kinase/FMN adenylyltransferase
VYRWQGLDEVPAGWGESVVTIGKFDGVHLGHQRIVDRAAQLGREFGLPVVAVTFDPHPD